MDGRATAGDERGGGLASMGEKGGAPFAAPSPMTGQPQKTYTALYGTAAVSPSVQLPAGATPPEV